MNNNQTARLQKLQGMQAAGQQLGQKQQQRFDRLSSMGNGGTSLAQIYGQPKTNLPTYNGQMPSMPNFQGIGNIGGGVANMPAVLGNTGLGGANRPQWNGPPMWGGQTPQNPNQAAGNPTLGAGFSPGGNPFADHLRQLFANMQQGQGLSDDNPLAGVMNGPGMQQAADAIKQRMGQLQQFQPWNMAQGNQWMGQLQQRLGNRWGGQT